MQKQKTDAEADAEQCTAPHRTVLYCLYTKRYRKVLVYVLRVCYDGFVPVGIYTVQRR